MPADVSFMERTDPKYLNEFDAKFIIGYVAGSRMRFSIKPVYTALMIGLLCSEVQASVIDPAFSVDTECEQLLAEIWPKPFPGDSKTSQWSPDLVLWIIHALRPNYSVAGGILRSGREPGAAELMSFIRGRDVTGLALYKAGSKFFGNWEGALRAAGLDPNEVSVLIRWSNKDIIEIIQQIEGKGILLSPYNIRATHSQVVSDLIYARFKKRVSAYNFITRAVEAFGSWENALTAAGFQLENTRTQVSWEKPKIPIAIRALHQNGTSMNSGAIQKDTSLRTTAIILDSVGYFTTGTALHDRALHWFGNWDNALRAAGLEPALIRKTPPSFKWTKEKIILAIQTLSRHEIPLNYESVFWNQSEKFLNAMKEALGSPISGENLIGATYTHLGNWSEALSAAGFDPYLIRLKFKWSKANVIESILALRAAGQSLNPKTLERDPDGSVMKTLSLLHRRLIHGSALYEVARRHHGSWSKALGAAGIDPREVYLQLPSELAFSHHPDHIVAERVQEDGELRLKKYLIWSAPELLPDEYLARAETKTALDALISKLRPEQKALARAMLKAFESVEYQGIEELSVYLSADLHQNVSPQQIEALFSALSKESALEELR